jgi:CPA1 family monovalent cation:H+ antiporter
MTWRERALLAWCGPRGAVSLAVAVSLPLVTAGGAAFPRRDLLVFLAVVVVLVTLVGQTATLPRLLRLLRLSPTADELAEGTRARRALVGAALEELDAITEDAGNPSQAVEALRQVLELRRDHLRGALEDAARFQEDPTDLRLHLLAAERAALRELHRKGEISRPTMVAISQELDADETALRRRSGHG